MAIFTYEQIKQEFEKRNYILLSTEYKNREQELEYLCNKHKDRGIQKIRYSNFSRNRGCAFCMYEEGHPPNHLPEIIYKEETEKVGYIYKGINYVKNKAVIDFICTKHVDKGIQQANWNSIRAKKCSCRFCNGTERSTEDFKILVNKLLPNIEILEEYYGARKPIKCRCKIHNYTWKPLAYNLLSGFGCPECGKEKISMKKRTSVEYKMNVLNSLHPDIEFLSEPVLSKDKIKCKCKKCNYLWEGMYTNMAKHENATGCPQCAGTNSENKLIDILDKWNFVYERQKKFVDCKDISLLPFDVYLKDLNVLIEFDGEHHYYPIPRNSKDDGTKDFINIQKHDKIKTKYCKKNNIPLIRIPYWERDDMEYFLFDKLVKLNIIKENIKSA